MIVFKKAHPAQQAMSAASKPADLNEPGLRRNPGEPGADEAATGEYSKPRIKWQGLTLAIENPAGSVRRGRNRHGVTWEVRMRFDYGEILGTMGVDGDPVDVIVGPNLDAPTVYVVHQRRVNDWENFDEDKCCVGFDSQSDAEQAFLSNYNDPRFLGPVTAMPVAEFVAKVRATKDAPAMIKAILFFKGFVGPYLRGGKIVNARGYHGRNARAVDSPGQMSLFGSNEQVTPPRDELVAEHERLVQVLNSPSHEDDKAEAKKQAEELEEMKHGDAWVPGPDLEQSIRDHMESDKYAVWGLRVIPEGYEVSVGDDLPPSTRWDDGEKTDEELDGTSTIGIENGNVGQSIRRLSSNGYYGKQVALVYGDSAGTGEDVGERLISDARVAAVWSRTSKMTKSIVFVRRPAS